MDQLNPSRDFELTWGREANYGGLPLWRLFKAQDETITCLVFELSSALYLVLTNDPEGTLPPLNAERHTDIVALYRRCEALKHQLQENGWAESDAL